MTMHTTSKEDLTNSALYAKPSKYCDIVMKGGVTSGIVYPLAVCELAKAYQFKNVGGTSAGAIAAAATAAAELGRHSTHGGFGSIAKLPPWFSADSNLFNLFQPQPATKALFAVVTAPLGSKRGRIRRLVGATIRNFPGAIVLGATPGLILAISSTQVSGFPRIWGILSAILLILVGAAIGAALFIARQTVRAVPDNFYGLCTGLGSSANAEPQPLTAWLTDLLNMLAGKSREEGPLTFGDLWGRDDTLDAKAIDPALRAINLEVMTTCLTQGRPYRLPFESHNFYFDPEQFRRFFPQDVVDWMCKHRRTTELESYEGLVPLPDSADLPLVVATRMSLSFPFLLSAIPLYAVDRSRKPLPGGLRPEVCWFSDGGITSNLPVHFFDAPLPRWPTFDINLRDFHPDYPERPKEYECENVFLPDTIMGGTREWWTRFDSPQDKTSTTKQPWWRSLASFTPALDRLLGFVGSILQTMQNWVDNAQILLPGYRDRVVHISLSKEQGGTNLKMSPEVSSRLSGRGRCAGEKLRQRFADSTTDPEALSWDVHRWVRYRTIMAVLQRKLAQLQAGYDHPDPGDRSYRELISRAHDALPEFYRWKSEQQQKFAEKSTENLINMARAWISANPSFTDDAPHPSPDLRTVPHL